LLLAHGRRFSPASSTTKTGRHGCNIAESGVKYQESKSNVLALGFISPKHFYFLAF
jgi:hypothetical protein